MDPRTVFEVGSTLCFQITVLIFATLILQRWVLDARSGCRLWTVCFLCVIGLVTAGLLLPHRRMFSFPTNLSREALLQVVIWQSRIAVLLASVWVVGIVVSLLRRALLCISLLRFLKFGCTEIDSKWLLGRAGLVGDDQSDVAIFKSDKIQGPFCWQLHRPVIVLPTFLMNEDNVTLRHVLLHELEHLRTQHPMQHFLQGVCSTVFWFHPLVWSAARGAELTREYLCDEVAAKAVGKFSAYLRTLATVAERCGSVSCTNVPAGTLAFGNRKSALILRSNRLVQLAQTKEPPTGSRSWLAIAALIAIAVLIQQVWLPTNAMASERSVWSPWPSWTANALHQVDIQVRDFEMFEDRVQMHELLYDDD